VPDRTAVFGPSARRLLMALGRYPEASLVQTGSPKYDDLAHAAQRWDRTALRARLGISPSERLVVVASRFRGIRETHQSIGSAFMQLTLAVESLSNVVCLVKPHPAEDARPYEESVRSARATRVRVLPPSSELNELLWCSDLLVTVESQSAIEALVLDRPVLILNMPTNLRALVDEGVALGVRVGEEPRAALRDALFDPETRESLRSARARYLADLALGMDGRATHRILDLVRETALRAQARA
jgi:CDP-glycerol glycerophosphotransferase (TagB/SpsB family)